MKYDMTKDSPGKSLFYFAVPMVLGNIFQQLYNIIDSIVVGNYVGADALAAVGSSTSIVMLFVMIASGLSLGCSVIISQFFGAGKYDKMKTSISTATLSILAISVILMIIGILFSTQLLQLMQTPDNIFTDASSYLNIYFYGLPLLFLYNAMNAVFNGLGKSKVPLCFLLFSSCLNIALDLLFVIHFNMGVPGVAWATLISQGVSAAASALYLIVTIKRMKISTAPAESGNSFLQKYFSAPIFLTMYKIAIPSCLQQSIVSIGFLCVQALVNSYGSVVIAGFTAANKIDGIAIVPFVNIGNAVSTFTAQNIGAKKPERVKQGYHMALKMIVCVGLIVTGLLYLFGPDFVAAFVDTDTNPGVIAVGVEYLRVVSVFYMVMGIMNSTNGLLRGAGDIRAFVISTLCNFTTRVAAAYLLAMTPLGHSAVWWAIPLGWFVALIISFSRYRTGKWKEIKVI